MKKSWAPNLRYAWRGVKDFPGTFVCYAITDGYAAPIGELWFSFLGIPKTMSIIDIHVNTHFRRQGVANGMLKFLNSIWNCDKVTTGSSSSRRGTAWVKAFGFKQEKSGMMKGQWVYVLKKEDK